MRARSNPVVVEAMAQLAIYRFYDRLFHGSKAYGPSVLDQIRCAESTEDIDRLLTTECSAGTRRKWTEAAERRREELGAL